MGRADYYADGQWNFFCDFCGAKEKSSKGEKTWNGSYVCRSHREERNPQDFLRGVKDNQSVPWTRPAPTEVFVPIIYGRSFSDNFPFDETVTRRFNKNIGLLLVGGGLNFLAINAKAINAPGNASADPRENLIFTETVSLSTSKKIIEALPLVESISFVRLAGRSLNGARLNSFALG